MKPIALTKRQLIQLILLALLLGGVFVAYRLAGRRQDIRNRAAGTGAIQLTLEAPATVNPGQTATVNIMMYNSDPPGTAARQINTTGADMQFDPNIFTVSSNPNCGTAFPVPASATVNTNTVSLTCFIGGGGGNYSFAAGSSVKIGSFQAQVKNTAAVGSSTLTFTRTEVPDAVTAADLADAGTSKNITINNVTTPSNTPTPSATPTPGACAGESNGTPCQILTASCTCTGPLCLKIPCISIRTDGICHNEICVENTPTPTGAPTITPAPTVTPSPSCIALPMTDLFGTRNIDSTKWSLWNSGNGSVRVMVPESLSVSAGGTSVISNGGLITRNKVCGDFDASVDVSQFTTGGGNEGVAVISAEQMDTNSAIYIQMSKGTNYQKFYTDYRLNGVWQNRGQGVNTVVTASRLRIRRIGKVFSVYYDQKDGKGWQLLNTYSDGFSTNANILFGVGAWNPDHPAVSADFSNFSLTNAIPDPSITAVPPTPTGTLVPTPLANTSQYTIDVGTKQSLSFNISPAVNPLIRFKAKLGSVRATPDLYFRLRVRDEAATVNNPAQSVTDACINPPSSDHDYYIPVHAADGVYSAVAQNSSTVPTAPGAKVAPATGGGWVTLDGITPGKYYTLYLKGPMTRKSRMVQHVLLQPGQSQSQDFDWSAIPLDPGDLPDPNNSNKQDCVINAADWSLVKTYIGANKPDPASALGLSVADVNYDGQVNSADSVAILETLSNRPDDDL